MKDYFEKCGAGGAPLPPTYTRPLSCTGPYVPVMAGPDGYGLLPITLSIAQVASWTQLGKTKVQELVNQGELVTSKVDARTLVLTSSVLALIERNRVERGR
jgi:hypothetical protein